MLTNIQRCVVLLLQSLVPMTIFPIGIIAQDTSMQGTQTIGYRVTDETGRAEMSYLSVHNLIIIPVSINGSLPLNFILDCGISQTIVTDPSLAAMMRLKPEREINIMGAGGEQQIRANVCTGNRIALHGVRGDGIPVILLQEDYLSLSAILGIPIFGLLGGDIFRELVVSIDYGERRLAFVNPQSFTHPFGYQKVPIRMQGGKPYLPLHLEQTEGPSLDIEVLADLGASHFLLLETQADERLVIPSRHLPANVGFGLSGPIQGSYARAHTVRLGRFRLNKPIISYTQTYNPFEVSRHSHGTIGGEFLCRFHVIFDLSREVMYFQKNRQYNKIFTQDRSGLGVMAGGNALEQIIVYDVRQGSPAWQAGMQAGDRILRLNGARLRDLDRINTMMRQREGKKIHIVFERDQQIKEVRFELSEGI